MLVAVVGFIGSAGLGSDSGAADKRQRQVRRSVVSHACGLSEKDEVKVGLPGTTGPRRREAGPQSDCKEWAWTDAHQPPARLDSIRHKKHKKKL